MIDRLPLILYVADVLSGIYTLLFTAIAVSSLSLIGAVAMKANIFFCGYERDKERYYPAIHKILKVAGVAWLVAVVLQIAIPSKGTIYAYAGITIAETVSNNPVVGKIERLVNMKLDEMLTENKAKK